MSESAWERERERERESKQIVVENCYAAYLEQVSLLCLDCCHFTVNFSSPINAICHYFSLIFPISYMSIIKGTSHENINRTDPNSSFAADQTFWSAETTVFANLFRAAWEPTIPILITILIPILIPILILKPRFQSCHRQWKDKETIQLKRARHFFKTSSLARSLSGLSHLLRSLCT